MEWVAKDIWTGFDEKTGVKRTNSEMYLISAYFDQRTTKILQKQIDRIARETGNTFMTQITELGLTKVNPHEDVVRFVLGREE